MRTYNVLIPCDKTKKTFVRGLWRNDNGKLFYDYLSVISLSGIDETILESLRTAYKQEALFAYTDSHALIFSGIGKTEVLINKRSITLTNRESIKKISQLALSNYNGLTWYIKGKYITIETWTK